MFTEANIAVLRMKETKLYGSGWIFDIIMDERSRYSNVGNTQKFKMSRAPGTQKDINIPFPLFLILNKWYCADSI